MFIASNSGITSAPTLSGLQSRLKTSLFPDHLILNCFRLLLYTMYISGLVGLYLSLSK